MSADKVKVPAGSPDEFQGDVELAILQEFPPDELRRVRQRYNRDGREAIREAAEDFIAEETPNREEYLDALTAAFEEVLGE